MTPTKTLMVTALASLGLGSSDGAFTVLEDGVAHTHEAHEVMCSTDAGWADLWIRLAGPPAGRQPAFYLDLDVCDAPGAGAYEPLDPKGARCPEGRAFDVWWHGEDGAVFVNPPDADPCRLDLEWDGETLSGRFGCDGLSEEGGERVIGVTDGTFECRIDASELLTTRFR